MSKTNGKELVLVGDQSPVLVSGDIGAIIAAVKANLGDEINTMSIPRIKFPTGGNLMWNMPSLDEEPKAVKTIHGVMLHQSNCRAYWPTEFVGNTPPTCTSEDGLTGHGDPGGNCKACPFSEFGSAKGGEGAGQACKQMRRVLFLDPAEPLPVLLVIPPTSLKAVQTYMYSLSQRSMMYTQVITGINLVAASNKGGVKYAQAAFFVAQVLTAEQHARMAQYIEQLAPIFSAMKIEDIVTAADAE